MANKDTKSDDYFGFKPISDEDLGFVADGDKPSKYSPLESAGKGAVQGATLGFADELGGGTQVVADYLSGITGESPTEISRRLKEQGFTGDLGPTSSGELYNQARDENRADYAEAQKENPKSYMAGEVGSALLPGAGSLGALGKSVEGASLLSKAARGAATGAALGGLSGAGYSEGNDLKGDVLNGAELGGGLGAAFPLVMGAASKAGSSKLVQGAKDLALEKSGPLKDFAAAYKYGEEGKNLLTSDLASEAGEGAVKGAAKDIQHGLLDKLDENFQHKMNLLKAGNQKFINFDDLYTSTIKFIDDQVGTSLDPTEAEALKKQFQHKFLKELPKDYKNIGYKRVTTARQLPTGEELPIEVSGQEPQLPRDEQTPLKDFDLKERQLEPEVTTKFKNGKPSTVITSQETQIDAIKDAVLKGNITPEEGLRFVKELQEAAFEKNMTDASKAKVFKNTAKEASDLIEKQFPETTPLNAQSKSIYDTFDRLNDVELKDPKLRRELSPNLINFVENSDKQFKTARNDKINNFYKSLQEALPEQASQMEDKASDAARLFNVGKEASTMGIGSLQQILGSGKAVGLKAANLGGLTQRGVEKAGGFLATPTVAKPGVLPYILRDKVEDNTEKNNQEEFKNTQNKAYNASPEDLMMYSKKIEAVDPHISSELQKAVQTNDLNKKNQLLFTIMQKPNLRKVFSEE